MTVKRWKSRKRRGGNAIVNNYKYILSSFAYSDAKHDFSDNQFFSNYADRISENIPPSQHTIYSENQILRSVKVTYADTTQVNASNDTLLSIINELEDIVDVHLSIDDKLRRHYLISTVHYQDGRNIITDLDYFPIIFGGKRTFVIDFFNMKFLDGFKNNDSITLYDQNDPYYILYNRETVNDPAHKPILEDIHYKHRGYCLKDVDDIDTHDIVYSRWQDSNIYYNNMFYSTYDYILQGRGNDTVLHRPKRKMRQKSIKKNSEPFLPFFRHL